MIYSLKEKIGQMLMVGFRGTEIHTQHTIQRDIEKHHLGGIILYDYDVPTASFGRNITSRQQLGDLIKSLKLETRLPLLIALDQEGGKIGRLKPDYGFSPSPTPKTLGSHQDKQEARRWAKQIAQDLQALQVNLNLAPVVDLEVRPDCPSIGKLERSFSRQPEVVVQHAQIFIEEHHRQNILCTLKHFPGHGSSSVNSHHGLTDISDSWLEEELQPYRALIKSQSCDAIMVSHLVHRAFDPEFPASLSPIFVHDLLRQQLQWQGVVLSDDLQMKAIVEFYGTETALRKAIQAGIDILILSNNSAVVDYDPDLVPKTIHQIETMVKSGVITKERIDESFQRILSLKAKINQEPSIESH